MLRAAVACGNSKSQAVAVLRVEAGLHVLGDGVGDVRNCAHLRAAGIGVCGYVLIACSESQSRRLLRRDMYCD